MSAIEPTQGANLPAAPSNPMGRPEGLEDFGTEDQVMPFMRIDHKEGHFIDSLSSAKYSELNAILLGLVKQRILWPANMTEGDHEPPLCRSYDFQIGYPSKPQELPNGTFYERFPWDASGFPEGTEQLPCGQCPLKEWGSHPTRDAPWCSEQHTFAMLLPQDDGNFVPCLFQLQRSGLKPSRQYLSSFANANQPLFTVYTKITLEGRKMGNNPFHVPKFENIGPTEQENFPMFSQMYRGIRDFLTTPRVDDEADNPDSLGSQVEQPITVQQQAPVQQPVQQQAPVQQAPAQPTPAPQPAPPVQPQPEQPVQQPAAQPQEPAPAVQQTVPVSTPTAPVETPQTPVGDTQEAAQAPSPGIAPGIAPPVVQQQPVQQAPVEQQPVAQPAPQPMTADDDEIPF